MFLQSGIQGRLYKHLGNGQAPIYIDIVDSLIRATTAFLYMPDLHPGPSTATSNRLTCAADPPRPDVTWSREHVSQQSQAKS